MELDCPLLNANVVNNVVHLEKFPTTLTTTNAERKAVNDSALQRAQSTTSLLSWSQSLTTNSSQNQLLTEYFYETSSKLKGLPEFVCYIGMPVQLTENIKGKEALGLANGAMGVIVEIVLRPDATKVTNEDKVITISSMPQYIVVRFDTYSEPKLEDFPEHCRPVFPVEVRGCYRINQISFDYNFSGFPLKPRFAQTIHSAQGLTLEHIVVGHPLGAKSLYVALSRAKKLKDVTFTRPFTADVLESYRPSEEDMMVEKMLSDLHDQTIIRFTPRWDLRYYKEVTKKGKKRAADSTTTTSTNNNTNKKLSKQIYVLKDEQFKLIEVPQGNGCFYGALEMARKDLDIVATNDKINSDLIDNTLETGPLAEAEAFARTSEFTIVYQKKCSCFKTNSIFTHLMNRRSFTCYLTMNTVICFYRCHMVSNELVMYISNKCIGNFLCKFHNDTVL